MGSPNCSSVNFNGRLGYGSSCIASLSPCSSNTVAFDVDSPGAVAIAEHASDAGRYIEEVWRPVSSWKTARRRIALLERALQVGSDDTTDRMSSGNGGTHPVDAPGGGPIEFDRLTVTAERFATDDWFHSDRLLSDHNTCDPVHPGRTRQRRARTRPSDRTPYSRCPLRCSQTSVQPHPSGSSARWAAVSSSGGSLRAGRRSVSSPHIVTRSMSNYEAI